MHALRKWLLSGLLVIVPLVITLGVLNWIIGTLDRRSGCCRATGPTG